LRSQQKEGEGQLGVVEYNRISILWVVIEEELFRIREEGEQRRAHEPETWETAVLLKKTVGTTLRKWALSLFTGTLGCQPGRRVRTGGSEKPWRAGEIRCADVKNSAKKCLQKMMSSHTTGSRGEEDEGPESLNKVAGSSPGQALKIRGAHPRGEQKRIMSALRRAEAILKRAKRRD